MSRKPRTRAGSSMPEKERPKPKITPVASATEIRAKTSIMASSPHAVHHGNRDHRNGEKDRDRNERSSGKARQAADAVTARAAGAKPRAEADEQTGKRKDPKAGLEMNNRPVAKTQTINHRSKKKS